MVAGQFFKINKQLFYKIISHQVNIVKGATIRTGIEKVTGNFVIVQDADAVYDPYEINLLLKPILDQCADVVYGSRFIREKPQIVLFFFHFIDNTFLTFMSNVTTNLNLTDMEACHKLFKSEHIKSIESKENHFGFKPEVRAKISKIPNIKIYEAGISYFGRTYQKGKKNNWKDFFRAI